MIVEVKVSRLLDAMNHIAEARSRDISQKKALMDVRSRNLGQWPVEVCLIGSPNVNQIMGTWTPKE